MIENITNVLNKIEYGFKDELGNNIINFDYDKWENNFEEFYYLQTPEELLNSKCGVCWDQVELERKLFEDNDIKYKTYFVYYDDKGMLPSHTFLIFELNNKVYWFEHSWGIYQGIHEYDSFNEAIKDICDKFKKDHLEVSKDAILYLYQYDRPKKHIKCNEFYEYIKTQKKIEIK